MKVGLYFGSFNPPHLGHLTIAHAAIKHAHLDEIWFVVSPQNPFKTNDALAPENQRLAMVELMCAADKRLTACAIEFTLPKPSYTCDTLRLLSVQFEHEFHLIIGEDNWRVFNKWREYDWILKHYPVLVYGRRPTATESISHNLSGNVHFIQGEYLEVSATEIRDRIRRGESIAAFVDPLVESYITATGAYR
jgi:nicotinate-nucleotide adenylyltransferase